MKIQLSDHFTVPRLLRFVMPSIIMMIFTSIYGVVDGLFVSNYAGKTAFAAVNLIMPLFFILGSIGFMLGAGGAAIIGKTLGEGKRELACTYFSMMVYATVIGGVSLSLLGQLALPQIARAFGAEGQMLSDSILYGRITLCSLPCFMLQCLFQTYFVTAEKPKLGLAVIVLAGVTNIALDALLVAGLHFGMVGAAIATVCSEFLGGLVPIAYFSRKNSSLLRLKKAAIEWRILVKACYNGLSELVSNISTSIVNVLFNYQLLRLVGEDGVVAFGVIMYVNLIFTGIFLGYSIGSAPVISFKYGAGDHAELRNLYHQCLGFYGVVGIGLFLLACMLARPLAMIFVGYDAKLLSMTANAMRIFAISFVFSGYNIFGSSFFTALNNGTISAVISLLRTIILESFFVLVLPIVLGVFGVWISVTAAELLAAVVTFWFLLANRRRYRY